MSRPSAEQKNLAARLRGASSRHLVELIVDNARRLTIREVRQILLNPFVTRQAIEELLAVRRLLAVYEVRSAIARHRRTPQAAALRFIPGLFWRDLLEIMVDLRLAPAVRRGAEKYLLLRLDKLTVGEKVALARRAPPAVLARLRHDPSVLVVRSVLGNPRLTEETLLPLAASPRARPQVLAVVAANERWGPRYGIRVALSRNPQTPLRVLFEILPRLRRQDLEAVAAQGAHSWAARHLARELAAGAHGGAPVSL